MQITLDVKISEEIIFDMNSIEEIEREEMYYKLWEDDRL